VLRDTFVVLGDATRGNEWHCVQRVEAKGRSGQQPGSGLDNYKGLQADSLIIFTLLGTRTHARGARVVININIRLIAN